MKVSIITTCKNSESTIEDTIRSVLSQDHPNIEYIIIDGGSTDGTLEIINKYHDRISILISEPDAGFYHAINKGISLATGDIIGNLNSDDFYPSQNIISQVVSAFSNNAIEAVYGDLHYVDKNNTHKIIRNWQAGQYKEGLFLKGWMPPHPTFFVKKDIYKKYGVFNTELKSAADYEIMLRFIHKHKIKIAYLPQVLVKMRVGGKSNVTVINRIKANLEDRKAWKANGLRPRFLTLFLKPLLKLSQYWK
ncbi:MAG: glycosyltransferase [Bacteroidia bacterium]|nr:glycosyltransferase [Bacteroidia bacterium]